MQAQGIGRGRRPAVTVVVATYLGDASLARTLQSLARQSLPADQFEVLVVLNGPRCASPEIVDEFRRLHPDLAVRTLTSEEPGLSNARNLAVAAARGTHLTYVDDDDQVSAGYLAALLAAAGPGVIPVAHIADVRDDTRDPAPVFENFYGRATLPHAGRTLSAERIPAVLHVNGGKLIPTALARSTSYLTDLRSGEDFVFWVALYAQTPFAVHVVDLDRDCVYYRTVRPGSMSQQDPSYDFNVTQRLDCIGALEAVEATTSAGGSLVSRMIDAQCRRVNELLREQPALHADVVADVRRRGLRQVRWPIVNEGLARDLAILFMFLPHIDASALVAARRIRERAAIVDVVTNPLTRFREVDERSSAIAAEYVDSVHETRTMQTTANWNGIRGFTMRCLEHAEAQQLRKGPYQSVYSRVQWPASHVAAALFKIRNPDCRWVAEMSDPMMVDSQGRPRTAQMVDDALVAELRAGLRARGAEPPDDLRLYHWIEHLVYVLADEVLFTNDNQRRLMLESFPEREVAELAAAKSTVQNHPTLPRDFYDLVRSGYELDPQVTHIGYFGTFYATRGLTEITEAIRNLSAEERSRVRLHVFTDKHDKVRDDMEAARLNDVVVVQPLVPFFEMLNLTTRLDVLLVNDARTRGIHALNPYLPSKWSDYAGSGTPVWVVYEEGSVLSTKQVRYRSRLGDAEEACAVLRDIARGVVPTDAATLADDLSASRL